MVSKRQVTNMPPDIILAILSKLLIKPLCRFKLVSKSWLSIINDVIKAGVYRKPQKLILSSNEYPFSFYTHDSQHPNEKSVEIKSFSENSLQILSSCNGVLLLRSRHNDHYSLFLWNPLTRKHRPLPIQWNSPTCSVIEGLGYDFSKDDFKIVIAMTNQPKSDDPYNTPIYVFSTILSSSCDKIGYFKYHRYSDDPGVVIKGSPHWIVGHHGSPDVIVYFDPRDETFGKLHAPVMGSFLSDVKLTVLGGDLCWVEARWEAIDLWVVREGSWSKLLVMPHTRGEFCATSFTPLCLVEEDDLNCKLVLVQPDCYALPGFKMSPYCMSYTAACYVETIASLYS